ncbi:MAG: hypothetical protein AB4426_20760 [Xenococcaceae cyanobacterium]
MPIQFLSNVSRFFRAMPTLQADCVWWALPIQFLSNVSRFFRAMLTLQERSH